MRIALGIVSFLLMVAFMNGAPDAAGAPRWALLLFTLPVMALFVRVRFKVGHLIGLAFLAYAIASMLWAPIRLDAVNTIVQLVLLALAFSIASEQDDLKPVFIGAAIGLLPSVYICVLQHEYIYVLSQAYDRPSGLFFNQDFMGEVSAMVLVGTMAYRRYVLALIPAFCLYMSGSSAAFVGVAFAGALWFVMRNRRTMWMMVIFALCGLDAVIMIPSAYDALHDKVLYRLPVWLDALDGLSLFGHGAGQFYAMSPAFGGRLNALYHARAWHAHNDLLEGVFEYGIGSIPLIALAVYALRGASQAARLVLVTGLVIGCVLFPLHDPAAAFLMAVAAGHLCGRGRALRSSVDMGQREPEARFTDFGPPYGQVGSGTRIDGVVPVRFIDPHGAGADGDSAAWRTAAPGCAAGDRPSLGERSLRLRPARGAGGHCAIATAGEFA